MRKEGEEELDSDAELAYKEEDALNQLQINKLHKEKQEKQ